MNADAVDSWGLGESLLRRTVKVGISLVYFALTTARDTFLRVARIRRRGSCAVLYYHSIPSRARAGFDRQMRSLSCWANVVDVTSLDSLPTNKRAVVLTFDDGLQSFVDNALPVLLQLKMSATLFVVAGALGKRPQWGREAYFPPEERVVSADQLRGLPGIVTIGAHTLSHPNLVKLPAEAAAHEISGSRRELEKLLGRSVSLFSFPFGAFNAATLHQCTEAGYQRVFTTVPSLVKTGTNQFAIGRVAVDPFDWPLEFRLKAMGAYGWQPHAHALRSKLRKSLSGNGIR